MNTNNLHTFDLIKKKHTLKMFQLDSVSTLTNHKYKKQLLDNGILYVLNNLVDMTDAWNKTLLLAKTLDEEALFVIWKLLVTCNNLSFSCAFSKFVLHTLSPIAFNCEHYINLAALLLVQSMEVSTTSGGAFTDFHFHILKLSYYHFYRLC